VQERLAVIGIIIEDISSAEKVNDLLHEYSQYIIGRMGIPYKQRGVSVITVVLDAKDNIISALSGKLGMIKGITVKSMFAKSGGGT
jgi:putative iron-only hydrogenase system regulator